MSELQQREPSEEVRAGVDEAGAKAALIAALQQNWRREREGALTYRDLAAREKWFEQQLR